MTDPLLPGITRALEDPWNRGCPLPTPANRELLAATGLRRWRSVARRHRKPDRLSKADRIRDLAKGLIETCEPDPALVGPLARDYEYVAETIVLAIEAAGDPIIAIDPACVAIAVTDQHATSDGVWALGTTAVEGRLKQVTAAVGRLLDVVIQDADFGHYGSGLCLLYRNLRDRSRWLSAPRASQRNRGRAWHVPVAVPSGTAGMPDTEQSPLAVGQRVWR